MIFQSNVRTFVLLNTPGHVETEQMTSPGQIRTHDHHFNARFRPLRHCALLYEGTNQTVLNPAMDP